MTSEIVIGAVTSITVVITLLINRYFDNQREIRKEAAEARKFEEQKRQIDHVGAKIDENTQLSVKAFTEANGHTEKVKQATLLAADVNKVAVQAHSEVMKELAVIKAQNDERMKLLLAKLGDIK